MAILSSMIVMYSNLERRLLMESSFEFNINKDTSTVEVKKRFNVPLELLWNTWTTNDLLDKWWAPKPYITKTKSMNFKEGGTWLYSMISPTNEVHWCKNDYQKIEPLNFFVGLDAFCDEEGNASNQMPRTLWTCIFSQSNEDVLLTIMAKYETLNDLEKIMELGFKEGFTMALSNLDELLLELTK